MLTASDLQVAAFVAPKQETVDVVNAWLKENDIEAAQASPAGDWLSISIPVSKANELLDANFTVFSYANTGKEVVRTLSYSIPTDLQGHIDLVHPTTACVSFRLCCVGLDAERRS